MGKFNIKFGSGGKWIESIGLGFLCIPMSLVFAALVLIIMPLCIIILPIAGLFGFLKLEEK